MILIKKVLTAMGIAVAFMCSFSSVNAQIFSETAFSSGDLVSNPTLPSTNLWYEQLRLEANRNRWQFKSGEAYLKKENNGYSGNVEAWLVTPEIELKAGSNIFSFDEKQAGASDNGALFSVRISTSSQDDVDGFTSIESYGESSFTTSYTTRTIDLSDFAGQKIYVAFVRKLVSEMGDDWYVDNVTVDGSDVLEASSFTITNITSSSIDLEWVLNASNDSVLLAWSPDGVFGDLIDLTTYSNGDPIAGGGTVLYYGDALTSTSHTSLTEFTPYYYKLWSVNGEVAYSYSGLTKYGTTIGTSTIEYTDFESGDGGWTFGSEPGWPDDHWYLGGDQKYRGIYSAYVVIADTIAEYTNNGYNAPGYVSLAKTITLSNVYKSGELSFFWKAGGITGTSYGEVLIDGAVVGDVSEYAGQSGWIEHVIDISSFFDPVSSVDIDVEFRWNSNAWNASAFNPGFCIDDIKINGSTIEKPNSLGATVNGLTDVLLSWNQNADKDAVLLAFSEDGNFGSPVKGSVYAADDVLPGGGIVLYNSAVDTSFLHSSVPSGVAYYRIWSVGAGNVFSASIGTSTSLPVILPFADDFEGDVSSWSFGSNQYHKFKEGKAQKNGGLKSAYVTINNGITASYSTASAGDKNIDLKLPVNLKGFMTADLDFYWLCDADQYNTYGQVFIDNNQLMSGMGDQTTWQSESISLDSYLGNISEIKFRLFNNWNFMGQYPGLCIDDVSLTGTIYPVPTFEAVNPNSNSNVLNWTKSTDAGGLDEVVIAWSKNADVVGAPLTGTEYVVGDELPGGGTVLYVGTDISTTHPTLDLNSTYYYKIWHKSGYVYSSTAAAANALTPLNLGFFDDFENEGAGYRAPWTYGTTGGNNLWFRGLPGNVAAFSGAEFAFITNDAGVTAEYTKGNESEILSLDSTLSLTGYNDATFSFYYKGDNIASGKHYGEVHINGSLVATYDVAKTEWTKASIDVSSYISTPGTLDVEFYWISTNSNPGTGVAWCIDNVAVYGSYDNTSTIADGAASEPTELSSLSDSEEKASLFMDFIITDGGDGDGQSTDVHQIVFNTGVSNTVGDLNDVIGGAYIIENGQSTGAIFANVYSSSLVFEQEDMISVADGTATTYELYVWVKNPMLTNGDGEVLEFDLDVDNIIAYNGSGFDAAPSVVDNSSTITVVASEMSFTTEPSQYAQINEVLSVTPKISAIDANGNIDLDYSESITITNDGALAMSGASQTAVAGVADFNAFAFTQVGGPVTLTASDLTLSGQFSDITIYSYCTPTMTSNTKYLGLVNINAIDNYSADEGTSVAYYLDQETNVSRGVDYDLTVGTASLVGDNVKAWFDWNQDGDFDDVGEEVDFGSVSTDNEILVETVTIPTDATLGGTRLRVMISSETIVSACNPGVSANGETEDYTVVITNNQWIGTTPTWDVPTNWSSGSAPSETDDVHIPADIEGNYFPIISNDVTVADLVIEDGAKITINEGVAFVATNIQNDGTIVLKNRQDNLATLYYSNSYSGTGVGHIFMYYPANRYWYSGFPVTGFTAAQFNVQDNWTNVHLWNFNSGTGAWDKVLQNSDAFDGAIDAYSVAFKTATTVQMTGAINSSDYTHTTTRSGFHSFANPYTCSLDLRSHSDANAWTLPGSTVWTRTTYGGAREFASYNFLVTDSAFGGSCYISPMQSFFILAGSSGDDFVVKQGARNRGEGAVLKSASAAKRGSIRLKLNSENGHYDETVIVLHNSGSEDYSYWDSDKMMSGNSTTPYIYSTKDDKKVAINVQPSEYDELMVPLNISIGKEGQGELALSVEGLSCLEYNEQAMLIDQVSGSSYLLEESDSYVFDSEIVADEARFILAVNKVATTSTGLDGKSPFTIWSNNGEVYVLSESINSSRLFISTIDGKMVVSKTIAKGLSQFKLSDKGSAFVVKVVSDNNVTVKKLIVR